MSWIKCKDALPKVGRLVVTRDSFLNDDVNEILSLQYPAGIVEKDEDQDLFISLADGESRRYFCEKKFYNHREWKYIEE